MDSCTRCNWSGPAGLATCPRCGLAFSSPAAQTVVQTSARPVLVLKLLGGELPPAEWEIEGVAAGIGRLDDSEVTLPHRSVSRHHARIVPTASGYEIEDLGSTNGTWLNDRPLNDRVALADGDNLMVGDIPLVVELIQPQRQAEPEIFDLPQLPAGQAAPARGPQAPAAGGQSTVFYELDAALAAAGPAEPPPPVQPAQRPADYQRTPSAAPPPPAEPARPLPPAQPPADYQRTVTPAPPLSAAKPPADYQRPGAPDTPLSTARPPADYQRPRAPDTPLTTARPPADYQRPRAPDTPLTTARPPADYQRPGSADAPLSAAKPPADYQRPRSADAPLTAARPPADYQRPRSADAPLTAARPPADYLRTPPPAAQAPPTEVEVPRAWDDTPSTRYDLPRSTSVDSRDAASDEHPTLIAEVPTQQSQSPSAVQPPPAIQPPPAVQQPAWYEPTPQREPPPAAQQPGRYEPQPAPAPTRQREPPPAAQQPAWYEPQPAPAPTRQREPSPTVQQPAWYEPQPAPAPPPTSRLAPSMPPAIDADLSAAGMIDLAERLATALRLLKGDIALAMWLFEHAGGQPAAQEFVDLARRLEADPTNAQDLQNVVESAPTAARLLEAAVLLVNVLSTLDPVGGVDNQPEADAADLQPVARS